MKVYQVTKDCSISYTQQSGVDTGFVLYVDDYFFIQHNAVWGKKESRLNHEPAYSKKNLLIKIYHNKMVDVNGKREWTLIDDINLVDPKINNNIPIEDACKFNPFYGQPICKDVTEQWLRDEKLNQLLC